MPPRISSNRGAPRRGRYTSRGGHPGGESRGSQLGGPSSIDTSATPEISDTPHVDIPSAIGGFGGGNHVRGRGRGRGRGSSHADAPGSPPLASATTTTIQVIDPETATITSPNISQSIPSGPSQIPAQIPGPIANDPTIFRGQPSGNRGRGAGRRGVRDRHPSTAISPVVTASISEASSIASVSQSSAAQIPQVNTPITPPSTFSGQGRNRGRGRGRGASRGGGPGAPSIPATGETAPHSVIRGQPLSGRGGSRGSARPSFFDSPSPFSGQFSPGRGGGGPSGGFVAGIPGKLYYSTSCICLNSFSVRILQTML